MANRQIQNVITVLLLLLAADFSHPREIDVGQMQQTSIGNRQRDLMAAEGLYVLSSTIKCLLNNYDDNIGQQIFRIYDEMYENVKMDGLYEVPDEEFMEILSQKQALILTKLQSLHRDCSKIPHPCQENHYQHASNIPPKIENIQKSVELMSFTMKCLLEHNPINEGIYQVIALSFKRYQGEHDRMASGVDIAEAEIVNALEEMRKLNSKCESIIESEVPCSSTLRDKEIIESQKYQSRKILQRDHMAAEGHYLLSSTFKCLLNIYSDQIGDQIYKIFNEMHENVKEDGNYNITEEQFMDLLSEKQRIKLSKMQSIDPRCASIPYPCVAQNFKNTENIPQDLKTSQKIMETMALTMKCILDNGAMDYGFYEIIAAAYQKYQGMERRSLGGLEISDAATTYVVKNLRVLYPRCQIVYAGEEPCISLENNESSGQSAALQRDLLVAEKLEKLSNILKCLLDTFDPQIDEQINLALAANMQSIQKEQVLNFRETDFMDMLQDKLNIVIENLQLIRPECSGPQVTCEPRSHHHHKAPEDLVELQKNFEGIATTMKCLLSNGQTDNRIYGIIARSLMRYHESHYIPMSTAAITGMETSQVLQQLKELDNKCQFQNRNEGICPQHDALFPQQTINRDLAMAQKLGLLGATLECLTHFYSPQIGERIYKVWDGNLERIQKHAILKLPDHIFMDLINEKANVTLKDLQSIHPHCSNIPYECVSHNDFQMTNVPQEVYNLQHNLQGIGAVIGCILKKTQIEPRIHRIFAQAFVCYHVSHEDSKTSLVITEAETAHILADLKQLDGNCQMMAATEETCY